MTNCRCRRWARWRRSWSGTSRLATAFRQVVFAQVLISPLNTVFTATLLGVLPLFGVHLPLSKTLVLITFLAGLLPVVGNIISTRSSPSSRCRSRSMWRRRRCCT